jgi:hypothetical protein
VTIANLTLSPQEIGSQSRSTGTVTLSGPAPEGGATVMLTSTNRDAARVPDSFVIPAGQTSGTFLVESVTVGTRMTLSIIAHYGGTSNGASLVVDPQPLRAILTPSGSGCVLYPNGRTSCWLYGDRSTGDPVRFHWYIRTINGTLEWQTTTPIVTDPPTTCALMGGYPSARGRPFQVEAGLVVENKLGARSAPATTILDISPGTSCGYTF